MSQEPAAGYYSRPLLKHAAITEARRLAKELAPAPAGAGTIEVRAVNGEIIERIAVMDRPSSNGSAGEEHPGLRLQAP